MKETPKFQSLDRPGGFRIITALEFTKWDSRHVG